MVVTLRMTIESRGPLHYQSGHIVGGKQIENLGMDIDLIGKNVSKRMSRHLGVFYKNILISNEPRFTGELQDNTKIEEITTGNTTIVRIVSPKQGYYTDWGTNPSSRVNMVKSDELTDWALQHGYNPYALGKYLAKEGVRGQYFSQLSYSEFMGDMDKEIQKKLKESDWWK